MIFEGEDGGGGAGAREQMRSLSFLARGKAGCEAGRQQKFGAVPPPDPRSIVWDNELMTSLLFVPAAFG